ncbi:hypothetical protein H2198_006580 [Neophaeococcomyces mojaviensis]|uniref:Uncharacterized protein n=1 Tax=Neophaeococcomyces mojaviensis TaxID=3383035 RepID=A0ACC3A2J6_9EURO|nr:hypothetical protein H2198_006580 [Knufia sp. JES_112]
MSSKLNHSSSKLAVPPFNMFSVQRLEIWAAKHVQTYPLSTLEGAVIGVDATYYLDQCLNENAEEPLKVALGGTPFCLTARIEEDLQAAKEAGVKLLFIFDGLDYVNKTPAGSESAESRKAHDDGWSHYLNGNPKATVSDFGKAEYPLDIVLRHFRKILSNNHVDYLVAPFSALAWLAYLYHTDQGQPVDAIMSSTDAFLFDVDKVVLGFDAKEQNFNWLKRSDCENQAGNPVSHLFRDAQLLLGSAFLPPFPPLQRGTNSNMRDALNLLSRAPTVPQLCYQYREDPAVAALDYADRYKKALMTIRHHVIITADGDVRPLDIEHAPGDVHAFVGQRLPDELFFYISRGLIAPQVPNWLTSGEIKLTLPGGVRDCEPYRRLVIDQLNVLRLQSVKLLAESLHFYYQNRDITQVSWNGRSVTQKVKEIAPLKEKTSQWKVQESIMTPSKSARVPTMLSCLRMLKDKEFAQKTITKGRVEHPALKSQNEILSNVFWRFLHVRGFVDDKHQLTSWGLMLEAALAAMDGGSRKEEQGILAVELLRLGALNTQSVTGANVPTSDKSYEHRTYTNLCSKIACLGRLKHETIGYVGPLDRDLLTFAREITSLRQSLRDLAETILVSMFLNGDALRDRDDWQELPTKLPFIGDNGSSLGIAVKSYFDALNENQAGTPLEELKEQVKSQQKPYNWFSKVESGTLTKSLDTAFKLFDAVYAAVKAGGKEVKDAHVFDDASEWLSKMR